MPQAIILFTKDTAREDIEISPLLDLVLTVYTGSILGIFCLSNDYSRA